MGDAMNLSDLIRGKSLSSSRRANMNIALQALRVQKKMTTEELSKVLGMKRESVSRVIGDLKAHGYRVVSAVNSDGRYWFYEYSLED